MWFIVIALVAAAFFVRPYAPHSLGLAVIVIAWSIGLLKSRRRFFVNRAKRTLETPEGHAFALATLREVSVKSPDPTDASIAEVMVDLGHQRWVPAFVGHVDEAKRVAAFIEAAMRKHGNMGPPASASEPEPPARKRVGITTAPGTPVAKAASRQVPNTPEELRLALQSARDPKGSAERIFCGVLVRGSDAAADAGSYANLLAQVDGESKAPAEWVALTRSDAIKNLEAVVGYELAYGYELLNTAEARFFAEAFVGFFVADAEFFTTPPHLRISGANFDRGVLGMDRDRVGLLWVESDSPGR
jgi:hypothetical protein